ncbi:hypothetical protein V6N12_065240 [Hibiscus sabdariffa]|uniref:Uncharacterized protein n=1 Tax=Hibiscus sabdariffa TaxID=183260 RepID=A0ABR2G845_9ROSI
MQRITPLRTELKPQAPIPLHPPLRKWRKRTPKWQTKLQAKSTTWQFTTKGKQALRSPMEVEETGEVKDVRPEEHAPRRARTEREAEEPLERGGDSLGAAPEPARVSNLGGGGAEDADEYNGGDEGDAEAVDGGDWSKRDTSPFRENEREEAMEGDIGDDVDGDGGKEKRPRGAKRLGVAPTEVDD